MDENVELYERYVYYKNKCAEMALHIKKLETAMKGCQTLLAGCFSDIETTSLSPEMTSTSKTPLPVTPKPKSHKRQLSFIEESQEFLFEPGANKYECLSPKEK
ncbi:Forkhead box protein K2 [Frankliniella fusca]|uniref:Forkhead box protein K2 n=1 Tax=Frankliniella fusca TaxID=407009 RepID=A0AAE1LQ59_9NEOP|nr:Forkhead box protein K2 [Frankliniella fusca]